MMPSDRETFRASTRGLLVVIETLVTISDKRGLGSRSMMEAWNRNVSSADMGIRVFLRRDGQVSDQHDDGCLQHVR